MKACLLIRTKPGKSNEKKRASARESIRDINEVVVSFPVIGRTDIVANVEVKDVEELSNLVLDVKKIDIIQDVETLVGMEV